MLIMCFNCFGINTSNILSLTVLIRYFVLVMDFRDRPASPCYPLDKEDVRL